MKSGFCLPLIQFHSSCPCYPSQFLHICEPLSKPSIPLLCLTDPQYPTLISGLLTSSSSSASSHFTCKLSQFPVTPAFFHIFWPELGGWPGGSSSTCSGFAKVLLRWSVHQSCSPQTLGQILPAFLTESRENTITFLKQCLSSFKNPLTRDVAFKKGLQNSMDLSKSSHQLNP